MLIQGRMWKALCFSDDEYVVTGRDITDFAGTSAKKTFTFLTLAYPHSLLLVCVLSWWNVVLSFAVDALRGVDAWRILCVCNSSREMLMRQRLGSMRSSRRLRTKLTRSAFFISLFCYIFIIVLPIYSLSLSLPPPPPSLSPSLPPSLSLSLSLSLLFLSLSRPLSLSLSFPPLFPPLSPPPSLSLSLSLSPLSVLFSLCFFPLSVSSSLSSLFNSFHLFLSWHIFKNDLLLFFFLLGSKQFARQASEAPSLWGRAGGQSRSYWQCQWMRSGTANSWSLRLCSNSVSSTVCKRQLLFELLTWLGNQAWINIMQVLSSAIKTNSFTSYAARKLAEFVLLFDWCSFVDILKSSQEQAVLTWTLNGSYHIILVEG